MQGPVHAPGCDREGHPLSRAYPSSPVDSIESMLALRAAIALHPSAVALRHQGGGRPTLYWMMLIFWTDHRHQGSARHTVPRWSQGALNGARVYLPID
jgi:hypothetical protein